jgi:hypothetical protein
MDNDLALLLLGEASLQARFGLIGGTLLGTGSEMPATRERSEQMWFALQAILTAAANINKTLWSGAREPTRTEQITERKLIRDALKLSDDSCLRAIDVRNSLEHFDDRLTHWYGDGSSPPNGYVGRAVTIGDDDDGLPPHMSSNVFVRYSRTSGLISFRNKSTSIPAVVGECQHIVDHYLAATELLFR